MKTASQLEARLKQLVKVVTDTLYERLEISDKLLKDAGWMANHEGSLDAASAYLASKYFPDLSSQFDKLIVLYQQINKTDWRRLRYDVAAVESLYDEMHPRQKGSRSGRSFIAEIEELTRQLTQAKAELATEKRVSNDREKELERLRKRVHELETVNLDLRGRLAELERLAKVPA